MKMFGIQTLFLAVMLCYLADIYHCFGGRPICCFLYPKDGGSRYLTNRASQTANYTASHATKP